MIQWKSVQLSIARFSKGNLQHIINDTLTINEQNTQNLRVGEQDANGTASDFLHIPGNRAELF